MSQCLICPAEVEPFLDFGRMPIANGFLPSDEFSQEHFFPLEVGYCAACTMVQLTTRVDPDKMFHDSYAFFSSTSVSMAEHFRQFAEQVREDYLPASDGFVVEIGSNDGILLRHFAEWGIQHLGVEPSANVAEVAMEQGVQTVHAFFDEALAHTIVKDHGQAHAILGANVMCHIEDLHSVATGIKTLLHPQGVLAFEDPYLGDIIQKTAYDQMYDEHVFYFSVSSISRLFGEHGMEVIDVAPQPVHGGSMRYIVAHEGARPVSDRVAEWRQREAEWGLQSTETFTRFRGQVERSRTQLVELLQQLRSDQRRVVGYAATSKSTTVVNYCQITPDLLEFISDTTPIKQGKFSPGMHIPVRPYVEFERDYPDYALLFAWNHAEEILTKEQPFRDGGGQFIRYVPEVEIMS